MSDAYRSFERFGGEPTNLHAVWDDPMVESYKKWSSSEWVANIDILNKSAKRALVQGTPEEWLAETPAGSDLSYQYMFEGYPIVEQQLLKGGLRLAEILNSIYN